MSNLDEDKVKELLTNIVNEIFYCLPDNYYINEAKLAVWKRIRDADLLARDNDSGPGWDGTAIVHRVEANLLTGSDDDDSVQPMNKDWS